MVQRPGSLLAALNAPLVRRFGMTRDLGGRKRPPAVTILDGARNHESATRLRALMDAHDASPWVGERPMLDLPP